MRPGRCLCSTRAPAENYLAYAPTPASSESTPVEVPSVVGRTLADAKTLIGAAGLRLSSDGNAPNESGRVASQRPEAGSIAIAGSEVALVLASQASPSTKAQATQPLVVCIDPGHQSHSNTAKEPVGPGSKTMKAKVTGGRHWSQDSRSGI